LQLLFIAKDHVDIGHPVRIIGSFLHIATDSYDKGMGILTSCMSQKMAALAVGNMGYGARVQDVDGGAV